MDVDFLTDKIRELCAQVVVAQGPEFERVIDELRRFVREHRDEIRELLEQPPLDVPARFDGHPSGWDHRGHLC